MSTMANRFTLNRPLWALGLALAATWLLAGGLAGCAVPTTVPSADARPDLQSPSEDSDTRRRARTRLALATSYLENGQTAVALDEQKKVLQIDPSFSDAYALGGLIYMSIQEPRLAEANFQRAIELNPRDANAMHNLGWLQCQQARYPEATANFERAMVVPGYGEQAKTLMARGICEARAGDSAKAEASLMRSYELDAGNPVTGYNLAQLLYQRGDYSRAQFYIRRLNNSELANAESLWLGIKVERRLNNSVAVQQLAGQLRRRFPNSRELQAHERGAFDD